MSAPLWFTNPFSWSLQVAVLVIAAAVLPRLLQIRLPRLLLAYWRVLLLLSLALPLLQPWHRLPAVSAFLVPPDLASAPTPSAIVATNTGTFSLSSLIPVLAVLLLAGICLRFFFLALGLLKLRQLRLGSSPIDPADPCLPLLEAARTLLNIHADFRVSAHVDSPVTFGLAAPVILLPARFLSLEPRFQSAIACHELLHVRRRDWVHHLSEEFLRALFWFHPAIAWLVSRIRLAREQVVDLEVVRLTNSRKTYLEALLEFTSARARIAAIPAPPFLIERQLAARVSLMLKEVHMSRQRLIASLVAIACCLAMAVVLAAYFFPLKAAATALPSGFAAPFSSQIDPPLLQRVDIKHHDFDAASLQNNVLNEETGQTNQLSDRPTAETPYDEARAAHMKQAIEQFWSDRGLVVEVRTNLIPSPRSTRYAVLQFDVYKQTLLPGRLEGGISNGVSGGVGRAVSNGTASGVSGGVSGGVSSAVSGGVGGAIKNGVSNGISSGVDGGVSGALRTQSSSSPSVDISTIWVDTVKRGVLVVNVRGLGKLARAEESAGVVAAVTLPTALTVEVKPGQAVVVDTHKGIVKGKVIGLNASAGDTRTVLASLEPPLPQGLATDAQIDCTIAVDTLDNVLSVGRPAQGAANSTLPLFKIADGGKEAVRVNVKLGRSSVNKIEVLDGLKEGDKIILSDMSTYNDAERIRLTDERHLSK